MSVLEWLAMIEGVLLLTAGIFWTTGLAIGRDDPDDPFTRFYVTFWRVFLRRRGRLRSVVSSLDVTKARQYQEMKFSGDVDGIKELLANEVGGQFDDSEISAALDESIAAPAISGDQPAVEAASAAAEKPRAAIINVKVIPFSQQNELVSMRRDGISVQVTCGPEEGQANKVVLEVIGKALNVKPYQVTLLKGHYKAFKVVQINGFDQQEMDLKLASYS